MRLAETVCGWHNPPGARKCEEIPYALIRLMTSHYQWDINAQTKHAPPRLGAPVFASRFARLLRRGRPLRYGPRHYMSPQVPWVPFPFLLLYRGSVRLRSLHRLPNVRRPLRGFKLGGHAPAVIHISVRLRLTRTLGAYAPTRERSLSLARTFGLTASREEHLTVLQLPIYRAGYTD